MSMIFTLYAMAFMIIIPASFLSFLSGKIHKRKRPALIHDPILEWICRLFSYSFMILLIQMIMIRSLILMIFHYNIKV